MLTPVDFILCIIGWLVYSLFILRNDKGKIDTIPDEKFLFSKYVEDNWDDWAFTLAASIGLLLIAPDTFLLLSAKYVWMEGVFWSNKIAFFLGAFGGMIFQGIYELIKKLIKKWTGKDI